MASIEPGSGVSGFPLSAAPAERAAKPTMAASTTETNLDEELENTTNGN